MKQKEKMRKKKGSDFKDIKKILHQPFMLQAQNATKE